MKNSSLIGGFLKDERKRLKLSQAEAAEKCGVSREIWGKYERGVTMPGSEALYAFAHSGADMQYVFTGIRSSLTLSATERLFLERFRVAPKALQDEALLALLGQQGQLSSAKQIFHAGVGQAVEGDAVFHHPVTFDLSNKK